jgi:N-acetylneuraminic acid mutarotase
MSEAQLAAATVVIDGKLYTVGITEKAKENQLLTLECLDPRNSKWQSKNKLCFLRGDANIIALKNKLYLCGGVTTAFISHNTVISNVLEHYSDVVMDRHSAGTASV